MWWPGLDDWLGEETDAPALHAVGYVAVSGRPVEVILRTHSFGPDRVDGPALTVGCDGKNLWITGAAGTPSPRPSSPNRPPACAS